MKNTLRNGDCLEVMKDIPDNSVEMILCDLPYGTTGCRWDSIIPLNELWEQYIRVLTVNGTAVLFASQPFTTQLIASKVDCFKYEIIWLKNKSADFINANYRPMKNHENICVFSKGNAAPKCKNQMVYNPQGVVYTDKKRIRRKGMGIGRDRESQIGEYNSRGSNYPKSVISFSLDNSKLHPTQKPVELLRYLIRTYTNSGQSVMDNAMGSGSTIIAAALENRNYIGIEKDEVYFETSSKRLEYFLANGKDGYRKE